MKSISLMEVSKIYTTGKSNVYALNQVDFSVSAGEYVVILGKSGSGKSTLLNMLGLIDAPGSGKILMDGRDILNCSEGEKALIRNKEIGFIFQSFYLEPTYSVRMNVEMPLLISGVPKKARIERVHDVLAQVGLEHKYLNRAYELSGGEKQRVCIARALINNPDMILADEPCGNLDSENTVIILEILKQLHKKGKTIILVTHSEEDGQDAQRAIYMKDGKILK